MSRASICFADQSQRECYNGDSEFVSDSCASPPYKYGPSRNLFTYETSVHILASTTDSGFLVFEGGDVRVFYCTLLVVVVVFVKWLSDSRIVVVL